MTDRPPIPASCAVSSISLKDVCTFQGASIVAGHLATKNPTGRKRQIKAVVTLATEELANTPAMRSDAARAELLVDIIKSD